MTAPTLLHAPPDLYSPELARRLREYLSHELALDLQCAPVDSTPTSVTIAVSPNATSQRRDAIIDVLLHHNKGLTRDHVTFTCEPISRINERQHALYPTITTHEESEIRKLWQDILDEAIQVGASDITIDPYYDDGRVRYTINGACRTVPHFTLPSAKLKRLVGFLRNHGEVKPDSPLVPGTGKLIDQSGGREVEMRIATINLVNGPRICLRLQVGSPRLRDLQQLGMSATDLERFISEVRRPDFSIVIAGRPGMGKTTTAKAALITLPDDMNIATLEHPVEMRIAGIAQVDIPVGEDTANEDTQVTFNSAFTNFLRQPINAVFVGEIRDEETMRLMLNAATSGISLISTVHTRNAAGIINRLIRLGASSHDISEALTLAMSQRLLTTLCYHCRIPTPISDTAKAIADACRVSLPSTAYRTHDVGCTHCDHGVTGRIGVFELLPITPDIADAIVRNEGAQTLERLGTAHGFRPMLANAMEHFAAGIVDEAAIRRALHFTPPTHLTI